MREWLACPNNIYIGNSEMEKEILYKYAQNSDGEIVHISNAVAGVRYYCPGCKEEFIFRHGQIRQRHFAHKNPSPSCTGEGYLHNTFKKILLEDIKEHINKNTPLSIQTKCNICKGTHHGNILQGISAVADEYSLGGCRPDIVLINISGKIPIIVEIVDTHEPEQNVIDYCVKNSTLLIIIKLESINDLDNIESRICNPTSVLFSNKRLCPTYMQQLSLQRQHVLFPNVRMDRRGPEINQIDAALEKKEYYNQKKSYIQRRRSKRQ
jgi:hypothetical protein